MPGLILHLGATVLCAHGGQATPIAPDPRVQVSGQPIATQASPYVVAGCTNSPQCVTAQYVRAAARVIANGVPVLLQDSQAICAPTGTPLNVIVTQPHVRAS